MGTNINSGNYEVATKKNEENLSALIWEDVQVPLLGKKREHRSIQNA